MRGKKLLRLGRGLDRAGTVHVLQRRDRRGLLRPRHGEVHDQRHDYAQRRVQHAVERIGVGRGVAYVIYRGAQKHHAGKARDGGLLYRYRTHDDRDEHQRNDEIVHRHDALDVQLRLQKQHDHAEHAAYRRAHDAVEGGREGLLRRLLHAQHSRYHREERGLIPQPAEQAADEDGDDRLDYAHPDVEMVRRLDLLKKQLPPGLHSSTSQPDFICTLHYTLAPALCKATGARLPGQRARQDEHGPGQLHRREPLVEEHRREHQRRHGVEIPQKRHRLRGQTVHRGEIHPAGESSVHRTQKQQREDAARVAGQGHAALGEENIGQEDDGPVSAPALGAGGRGFESRYPDKRKRL